MDNPLLKKLVVKAEYRMLVLNSPPGYLEKLLPLPEGTQLLTEADGEFDFGLVYVTSRVQVEEHAPQMLSVIKPGGVMWFAYPKRGKGIETDINRDSGWDVLKEAGYRGIANVAIDETWSAVRFKPLADITPRAA